MEVPDRKKRLCIVPVCHGERFDLVHKFPSDNNRAHLWRKLLNVPHLFTLSLEQIRKRYFVCSRHFKISDYKNIESRGLNKTAIPTKNLTELNDYDTIDQTIPKQQQEQQQQNHQIIFDEETVIDENVEQTAEQITRDEENMTKRLMLESTTDKSMVTRKRQYQTVKEYGAKRFIKKKTVNAIDETNLLAVLGPDSDFKEFKGQLVFHINHVESLNESQETKKLFLLPIDQNNEGKDEVEVIEDPDYANYEEAEAAPVEVDDGLLIEDEEEETNFVAIDEQDKLQLDESSDIVDIFMDVGNNKEDDDEPNTISETLDIIHPEYSEPLKFHHFWLRDHCRCTICYSAETFQRKFNIMDIPIDIKARECTIVGKELTIEWSDDHKSTYDLDFLCRAKYENHRKRLIDTDPSVLWDKNIIHDADYARVDFSDYLANGEIAKSVVRSLVKYGVAFIEKVPPNVQSTEIAIRNLFPIHKTFFGEMFTVLTDFKEFQDSAYSKEFLPAHTDNTYFSEASGLQILHVTQHNGTGGETILVDGFKAATELKRKYPDAYERLLHTNVPAEYLEDGQNHYDCTPLIKQNTITGELEQIRFNLYDRAPLHSVAHSDIMQYYKDFRLLANEIQSPQNEWWFKLNPGTVMIFNNWRVLHGRAQYTGKRSLAGSYVSRTDYMSKVRCLGILDN